MIEMPEGFDSIFRYIVVVSQRAEQLINGARARSEAGHSKPTLTAKEDVDQGLVDWRILTQEELDAQRQAIVDQFHADIGADGVSPDEDTEIPDVLPTAAADGDAPAEEAAGEEPSESDDELARLQRLLGMTTAGPAPLDDEEEVSLSDAGLDESEKDDDDDKDDE